MTGARSRYELLAKLASGGMATVYVGRARGAFGFSRLVAIKRPHPFAIDDPALLRQLEQEARVASLIHHPNVVSILDVEHIGDEIVLIMDYVEGCTLRELGTCPGLSAEALDRICLRVVLDVAQGLHAAHQLRDGGGRLLGVVHRDVSPQNVLVGVDGVARLADFGIAKISSAERDGTATDVIKGKLAYMPPEYLASRAFDARSDLFSLAIVTWEALARRRLFKGVTDLDTLKHIVEGSVPPLSSARPDLSGLDQIMRCALHRAPDQRYPSVEAFALALETSARLLGRLGRPGEVGAAVQAVCGGEITTRRRLLETTRARPVSRLAFEGDLAMSERDRMGTLSLGLDGARHPAREPSRSRRWMASLVVAAVLAVAGVAVFASVVTSRPGAPRNGFATGGVESPSVGPSPRPAPPVVAVTPASVEAAPGSEPAGTRRARATEPAPAVHRRTRTAGEPLLPTRVPPNPYEE